MFLTAAVAAAIAVAPSQGEPRTLGTFALSPLVGALSLARRRWPLGVLLASAASLQVYNLFDNPGIFAAVPLSVSLASAWAGGRRLWALVLAVWFGTSPIVFALVADLPEQMRVLILEGAIPDAALLAAVLLLGETIRGRRELVRAHGLLLAEQERSESLLLNVLPSSVADRLKRREKVIADHFDEVTVMFADLVGFTESSQQATPQEVVGSLDDLFSTFDQLAERHGVEKIKTIGDAYMVAGGLPEPRPGHAAAVADMALDVRRVVSGRVDAAGRPMAVRIGIDTGPVIAGVIGRHKFAYDLWGDTVNTASRMESHGVPGRIQVTERTYRHLRDAYALEPRGQVEIKGKGTMDPGSCSEEPEQGTWTRNRGGASCPWPSILCAG